MDQRHILLYEGQTGSAYSIKTPGAGVLLSSWEYGQEQLLVNGGGGIVFGLKFKSEACHAL